MPPCQIAKMDNGVAQIAGKVIEQDVAEATAYHDSENQVEEQIVEVVGG